MSAELSEKALRLRASIQKKVEIHNIDPAISEDQRVVEEELYLKLQGVDLDEDLGYQVACWKQLEQMCLSKQSLERLIDNIDHVDEFGLIDFQAVCSGSEAEKESSFSEKDVENPCLL